MLQSSDSALCMQTQQEGERGRLSLGQVPKLIWLGDRGVPAAAKASGVVDGEEPEGSDHAPGGWPPFTPGSGVGAATGSRAVCRPGVVFQSRARGRLCDLGQVPPHLGSQSLSL